MGPQNPSLIMKAVVSRYVNGHLSDREPRTEPGTELGFSQQIKTFTKQKVRFGLNLLERGTVGVALRFCAVG